MIKMRMFGLTKAAPPPSATKSTPVSTKSKNTSSSAKMFNLRNLDSIMKTKNTGCKSCGR